VRVGEDAADVATAFLFLDDADAGNGALARLPLAARDKAWRARTDRARPCADSTLGGSRKLLG